MLLHIIQPDTILIDNYNHASAAFIRISYPYPNVTDSTVMFCLASQYPSLYIPYNRYVLSSDVRQIVHGEVKRFYGLVSIRLAEAILRMYRQICLLL